MRSGFGADGLRRARRLLILAVALAATSMIPAAAPSATLPLLQFRVFSHTGIPLVDILWTGRSFLLVRNTDTVLTAMDSRGVVGEVFATLPRLVEETRCVPSPGAHGFPAGDVYCHTPDNKIYRISADGRRIRLHATLPETASSDGALAADTVGRFDYTLVAATGRSGAGQPAGGTVYTVSAAGRVRRVGTYPGPSGADQLAIAPGGFGSVGGHALLTVDAGAEGGTLVAISPRGRTRIVARFDDGPNPIAPLVRSGPRRGAARAGFYVTATFSTNVFFAPASQLTRYAGNVLVGSEILGRFWIVEPRGTVFRTRLLRTNLPPPENLNLEGAKYLAP
jgi:hypothetical protein